MEKKPSPSTVHLSLKIFEFFPMTHHKIQPLTKNSNTNPAMEQDPSGEADAEKTKQVISPTPDCAETDLNMTFTG